MVLAASWDFLSRTCQKNTETVSSSVCVLGRLGLHVKTCKHLYPENQMCFKDASLFILLAFARKAFVTQHIFDSSELVLPGSFQQHNCYDDCKISRLVTKPTKWHLRPANTPISLGIRPVLSESSLSAWRKLGSLATHWAHREDSDQTGRIRKPVLGGLRPGRTNWAAQLQKLARGLKFQM